jgi:hypothetical protein
MRTKLYSVDVEGIINSTAYAVKARYLESSVVRVVIVPKEEGVPIPTNYETIMQETDNVMRSHHMIDADSMDDFVRIVSSQAHVEKGDPQI